MIYVMVLAVPVKLGSCKRSSLCDSQLNLQGWKRVQLHVRCFAPRSDMQAADAAGQGANTGSWLMPSSVACFIV